MHSYISPLQMSLFACEEHPLCSEVVCCVYRPLFLVNMVSLTWKHFNAESMWKAWTLCMWILLIQPLYVFFFDIGAELLTWAPCFKGCPWSKLPPAVSQQPMSTSVERGEFVKGASSSHMQLSYPWRSNYFYDKNIVQTIRKQPVLHSFCFLIVCFVCFFPKCPTFIFNTMPAKSGALFKPMRIQTWSSYTLYKKKEKVLTFFYGYTIFLLPSCQESKHNLLWDLKKKKIVRSGGELVQMEAVAALPLTGSI